MKRLAVSVVWLSLLAGGAAGQYPTIVGSWYEPRYGVADCQSHNGLHIEPMSLLNGETVCHFSDVVRDGWEVTWTGQCGFSGEWIDNITVTAVEDAGMLVLRFGDGEPTDGFRRCPAGP
jgi:hypothetical protein